MTYKCRLIFNMHFETRIF